MKKVKFIVWFVLLPILVSGISISVSGSELPNNFWTLYESWKEKNEYPVFFGGVYYSDSRNLCVVVTESSDSDERRNFIDKYGKSITFIDGKYSYTYLKSLFKEITDSLSASPDREHICGVALIASENRVELTVEPCIFDSSVREYSERYGDAVSVKTGARAVILPETEYTPVWIIAASAATGACLLAAAAAIYQITIGRKRKPQE